MFNLSDLKFEPASVNRFSNAGKASIETIVEQLPADRGTRWSRVQNVRRALTWRDRYAAKVSYHRRLPRPLCWTLSTIQHHTIRLYGGLACRRHDEPASY